ncbi:Efflux transporter, outer membrane factor lipoprotein, NodT family [Sulfurovum sp. enrichment culture clone C5]|uniref:Efflux transporter, outer membrane factor lipoprotein, NodT family n=1 Tax=Sulfurovum sp. enrichment culture clone C5 TaxID=497650 RepID=A0A0S4XPQ5_9BACT|nr:Efflux transporter, outer membrane factor lipoprotein, NodT family [Sulfurovum sp. enrichment culture clone C5]
MEKVFLKRHTIWLFIMPILLLSGCATHRATIPKLDLNLSSSFNHIDTTYTISDDIQWWRNFNDPILIALIEKGLKSNHDIQIAMSHIKAARANYDVASSRILPTLDIQTSTSTIHTGLPEQVKQGLPDMRIYQGGINLAWEIDIGGGIHAAANAAESDAMSAKSSAAGVRLLIASEIARQYFILRGAEKRLHLLEELVKTQHESTRLISRRFEQGQSSRFELTIAEAQASALEAQIPSLQTLVAISQTHIALLIGENPSVAPVSANPEYIWPQSQLIGTGQPSDLLRRRPDLMAAEEHYGAESLRSKEAKSQTWPKLFINALIGSEDLRINGLNLAPVSFSNVAMAFVMPILNAGRIQAGIDIQSARENEALLIWQKSVIVAVKEVEDSLSVQSEELKRGILLKAVVNSRYQSLRMAQSLYREGQIDKLALLDIRRLVLTSEIALMDNETHRLLADVQLYKALGGGWNPSQNSLKVESNSTKVLL